MGLYHSSHSKGLQSLPCPPCMLWYVNRKHALNCRPTFAVRGGVLIVASTQFHKTFILLRNHPYPPWKRQGRSQAWAWGGLSPPNKNIAPPSQTKWSPFWAWAYVFWFFNITLDQLNEPATGGNYFSLWNFLAQTSAEISPPISKILATSCSY